MKAQNFQLKLDFYQIMELVKQLPVKDKIKLGRELEKELVDNKLSFFLKKFKTEELTEDDIKEAVEEVRTQRYEAMTTKGHF